MSTAQNSTLTASEKRKSSGEYLTTYSHLPATPKSPLEFQNLPDSHSVPELTWDETPRWTKRSPRTPFGESSPLRIPPSDEYFPSTPTKPFKEPRTSDRLKILEISKSVKQESSEHQPFELKYGGEKPALLFPQYKYPLQPKLQHLVKGDIGPRGFNFYEMSRRLDKKNGSRTETSEEPKPEIRHTNTKQHALEIKRVERDGTSTDQNAEYGRETERDAQGISKKTLDGPRDERRQPLMAAVTKRRFTRILPFNAIKRLIDDPNSCVASLVTRPDERCSKPIKSCNDIRAWLLSSYSKSVDPSYPITAENYLREFVNMATCTASRHRSIATEQLDRLLSRFNGSNPSCTETKHDFTSIDEKAVRNWLEELTKIPDTRKIGTNRSLQPDSASMAASIPKSGAVSILKKTPPVTKAGQNLVQEIQNFKTTNNITTTSAVKMAEITNVSYDSMEALPTCEIKKSVEIQQIIEISHSEHSSESEATAHSTQVTQSMGRTQATQKIDVPLEAVTSLEKTTKTTLIQNIDRYSTFDPTQKVEISLGITTRKLQSIKSAQPRRNGRQPTPAAATNIIYTLNQIFQSLPSAASRRFTLKQWLYECLIRELSLRESNMKPRKKRLDSPKKHEGLIYMYWVAGSFGLVKIGKTSGPSTANRLIQWRQSCGHIIEEHTRGEKEVAVQLPHVYRVEALVHAELNASRLKEIRCEKCSKDKLKPVGHTEWFCVSSDHAQKVIRKWSDWMLTKPYEQCKDGKWRLRSTISAQEIDALCTPIGVL